MAPGLLRSRIVTAFLFVTAFTVCCSRTAAQELSLARLAELRFGRSIGAQPYTSCAETDAVAAGPLRLAARCAMPNVLAPANQAHPTFYARGPQGTLIERAREHAVQILSSQNACSAWFREADPDAVAVLESLEYVLRDGPKYVQAYRMDSGETLLRHPYSALTDEGAGRGATVVLNRNGAFFVAATDVFQTQNRNWPGHLMGRRSLTVGNFTGGTLPAQITTLLHELAHIVGRIPDDSDDSTLQSPENTERVLYNCRNAIKSNLRHAAR